VTEYSLKKKISPPFWRNVAPKTKEFIKKKKKREVKKKKP
jgi:hypothetical protein